MIYLWYEYSYYLKLVLEKNIYIFVCIFSCLKKQQVKNIIIYIRYIGEFVCLNV